MNKELSKEEQLAAIDFSLDQELLELGIKGNEEYTSILEKLNTFTDDLKLAFEVDDYSEIIEALKLMIKLHIDQKYGETPYIAHPLVIGRKVFSRSQTPKKEQIIAALLHDSVEDQTSKLANLTPDSQLPEKGRALAYLSENFGERVTRIITSLSNPNFEQELFKRGIAKDNPIYKETKNKLYASHVQEAIEDVDVFAVKLADFLGNIRQNVELPETTRQEKKTKRYLALRYSPVIPIMFDRLQKEDVSEQFNNPSEIIAKLDKGSKFYSKILAQE